MSELELLLVVLVALYLWECACWLQAGSLALVRTFSRWRIAKPGRLLGNHGGGFVRAPLLPFGSVLVSAPYPLCISPRGLVPQTSPIRGGTLENDPAFIPWEQLGEISVRSKRVLADRKLIARTNSGFRAYQLAAELRELQKCPVKKREDAIRRVIGEQFDRKKLEKRWGAFASRRTMLRDLDCALFLFLLAIAPAVIWRFGLAGTWCALLICLLALTTGIAVTFHREHKFLYPALSDERFTHFLLNLLSPVTAVRSQESLTRPLLEGFHPVTLACALAEPADAFALARPVLRSLVFASGLSTKREQTPSAECRRFLLSAQREAMEKLLRQSGIHPEELLSAPRARDSECRSFCPLCEAQFTQKEGRCQDCGQAALQPLPTAPV